jgi:spore germination cell wall hydrolase CwlJ-like protein
MRASRRKARGATTSFVLAVVLFVLAPARIGYQDLTSLIARQPAVGERWRAHLIASPFGTIHAARFSFPHPLGTTIPKPVTHRLASVDRRDFEVTNSISTRAFFDLDEAAPAPDLSAVNRALKGHRLVGRPQPEWDLQQTQADDELAASPQPVAPSTYWLASITPIPEREMAFSARPHAEIPSGISNETTEADDEVPPVIAASERGPASPTPAGDASPAIRTTRVYFGVEPMGGALGTMEPWAPGEQPVFDEPGARDLALEQPDAPAIAPREAFAMLEAANGGETIAGKGEVTGEGKAPKSPAERLGLTDEERAKAEKCLAEAVYFESRGESVRGQIAVAQVVMNRVFTGYYPDTVCGVVYQNAHRRLACQFTFACDRVPDRVNEPDAWERAKRIARDTLDGKYWLADVGKATHYHAYWVHPWWVRTMRKLDKIGVHTFYRPRKWGDGSDTPSWGDAEETAAAVNDL